MSSETLNIMILGNSVKSYLQFVLFFIASVVIIKIFKSILLSRLKSWAEKTKTTLDDVVILFCEKKMVPVFYFLAFYFSIAVLKVSDDIKKIVYYSISIFIAYLLIQVGIKVSTHLLTRYWGSDDPDEKQNMQGIVTVIKIVIWGIGITFLLDNLGFEISAVIAGLGIGGVAVALAAQSILGDLFSCFSIYFDKPFNLGDFIIVGDYLGVVEHIGIKTTRIKSLSGEEIVFSNTDLTNSRVKNYKKMEKRRVLFKLGVTYQTTLEQLKEMPGIIKNIIVGINDTTFDRAHFSSYGDFALIYEIVYYVTGNDYNKYMDIQQEINFKIKDEFAKRSIEFAYPTQTIFVSKEN